MSLEKILRAQCDAMRAEKLATTHQLLLGELILKLEAMPSTGGVRFDFLNAGRECAPTRLMSWRGVYAELALGFDSMTEAPTVFDLIAKMQAAVGKKFEGYKGGEFRMGRQTPVWVSNYGESDDRYIVDVTHKDGRVTLVTFVDEEGPYGE